MGDDLDVWLSSASQGDVPHGTEAGLRWVESQVGRRLPDGVRRVLALADRPEGLIGESYIAFFNADDLVRCWRDGQDSHKRWIADCERRREPAGLLVWIASPKRPGERRSSVIPGREHSNPEYFMRGL
jgi:hypothetical protein